MDIKLLFVSLYWHPKRPKTTPEEFDKIINDYNAKQSEVPEEEPTEDTGALPNPPGTFKPLTLFDKYMFAKSYIRLLKTQLDRSRKQNRLLIDEITHLKTLFRQDKRLPKK